ncbi:hypothetical protein FOA43_003748 [Brettanomyces nanus]|uniref:Uncharacterized protein n=1 Tax=Eeniella nana TaxID=13502 RepID=A0A875RQA6_EENNA|nr:uncharacterized protein FOA43_003748 [Brettanomyces nanus]QPG76360.1 hypothetical protein FOA43_003748 [Brettanomyces nanus]
MTQTKFKTDLELLESQLVGPQDEAFAHTRFRDSPATICTTKIPLMEPSLSEEQQKELRVSTTPCMSLFGIYLHLITGLLIVYCKDRQSFTIRKTRYELQDVINRTMRNEIWMRGKAVEGKHYVRLNTSYNMNRTRLLTQSTGSFPASSSIVNGSTSDGDDNEEYPEIGWQDLSRDISIEQKRKKLYSIEEDVPIGLFSNPDVVIPMLPIYIGYKPADAKGCVHVYEPVDFSQPSYKKQIKEHLGGMLFFQNIYSVIEKYRVPVNICRSEELGLIYPSVDFPLKEFIADKNGAQPGQLTGFVVNWFEKVDCDQEGSESSIESVVESLSGSQPLVSRNDAHSSQDDTDEFDIFCHIMDEDNGRSTAIMGARKETRWKRARQNRAADHSTLLGNNREAQPDPDDISGAGSDDLDIFYKALPTPVRKP